MRTSRSRELTKYAAALWKDTARHALDELPERHGYRNLSEYPGYAVSADGKVTSYRGNGRGWTRQLFPRLLQPTLGANGVLKVRLQLIFPYRSLRVRVRVDELVAAAYPRQISGATWDGKPPDQTAYLVHKDGNQGNCAADNLEWVIPESRRAEIASERQANLQQRLNQAKLTARQVRSIRRQLERGVPSSMLARRYHVTPQTICRIGRGVTWRAA